MGIFTETVEKKNPTIEKWSDANILYLPEPLRELPRELKSVSCSLKKFTLMETKQDLLKWKPNR